MIKAIETANDLVRRYNQFKTPNELTDQIIEATGITQDKACDTAEAICKVVTFWIEATAKELIDMTFSEFYKHCIKKGYITRSEKTGLYTWMALSVEELAKKFDIMVDKISDFEEIGNISNDEWLGTVRKDHSWHSMICFKNLDSRMRISDTSKRGIDQPFYKSIDEDNFKYITIMSMG